MKPDDTTVFVVVSTTTHTRTGASFFNGPQTLVAFEPQHCPDWLPDVFDQGSMQIDFDSDSPHVDENLEQIQKLIKDGHAMPMPCANLRHLHMPHQLISSFHVQETASNQSSDKADEADEAQRMHTLCLDHRIKEIARLSTANEEVPQALIDSVPSWIAANHKSAAELLKKKEEEAQERQAEVKQLLANEELNDTISEMDLCAKLMPDTHGHAVVYEQLKELIPQWSEARKRKAAALDEGAELAH